MFIHVNFNYLESKIFYVSEVIHKSAQKFLKVILCVCVPEKGVMTEPDEVKNNQYYTEMHFLKVDMAKRVISKSGFQCLQLYQTAIDRLPFHDKQYHREDGSEPRGHFDLPENFHLNRNCLKCFEEKIWCGWIQCPRCRQWYHE